MAQLTGTDVIEDREGFYWTDMISTVDDALKDAKLKFQDIKNAG